MIIITFIYTLTRVNPYWPSQPMTQALPQSTPELDFKNMIIIIFLSLHGLGSSRVDPSDLWPESCLGLTLLIYDPSLALGWPFWSMTRVLPWVDPQIKFLNYDNNHFYFILTRVNSNLLSWHVTWALLQIDHWVGF
jgi:hypothetical protein